jgi:hypothetical protein
MTAIIRKRKGDKISSACGQRKSTIFEINSLPVCPDLHGDEIRAVELAVVNVSGQPAQNFEGELIWGGFLGHLCGINEQP